jgi:23S rRNA (cytidine1920-2'-O)/16S rRNA (cytidine1409-2'-O)-methyltransferase
MVLMANYVSRAGFKLAHGLDAFELPVAGRTCADLGCSTGGFVDCLLQRGAAKVFAIDTGYGVLDWRLRNDPRVVVMERTNAMHAKLPEQVSLVTIDVSWTRQKNILPSAKSMLAADGCAVTLIKPHYEADASLLRQGVLPDVYLRGVLDEVARDIAQARFELLALTRSPLGGKGSNTEFLGLLRPS